MLLIDRPLHYQLDMITFPIRFPIMPRLRGAENINLALDAAVKILFTV